MSSAATAVQGDATYAAHPPCKVCGEPAVDVRLYLRFARWTIPLCPACGIPAKLIGRNLRILRLVRQQQQNPPREIRIADARVVKE